jgi:cytochrome c-type biogenesis protein CcmH
MNLWFVFALMTAAAIFAVLWPLSRRSDPYGGGSDATIYRDQLAELDRDLASGLIGSSEADAARVEISRRLLAAAEARRDPPVPSSNLWWRRSVVVVALVGLPALAIAIYLPLGSPQLGDSPFAQRALAPDGAQSLDRMLAQVEAHLEKNSTDGRGWSVIAPVLARLGRYDEAVRAYRNSIIYNGDSAERRADLGEAIAGAAGGVVTTDAKAEFERAIALKAGAVKANYFLGLAAEQDGRSAEAASIWRTMLVKAPPDASWRPLLEAALARVGAAGAPGLSQDAVAAAKQMSGTDRDAVIRGMVERLAARLKQNGGDVDGWLRLVRAYMVMGDRDKARGALTNARDAVANDAERLRQLNDGLKNLGLDG